MAHVAEMENADQQMNAINMIEYVWMPISSNLQFPSFWPIHALPYELHPIHYKNCWCLPHLGRIPKEHARLKDDFGLDAKRGDFSGVQSWVNADAKQVETWHEELQSDCKLPCLIFYRKLIMVVSRSRFHMVDTCCLSVISFRLKKPAAKVKLCEARELTQCWLSCSHFTMWSEAWGLWWPNHPNSCHSNNDMKLKELKELKQQHTVHTWNFKHKLWI